MSGIFKRMGLSYNPFEPAAAGAPVTGKLWMPRRWKMKLEKVLGLLERGRGVKALAISGEYGSGKTYILEWLSKEALPARRIESFYFDNPGVQFYDLANALLRKIGRKNFAKLVWELVGFKVVGFQRSLFDRGFEEYLRRQRSRREQVNILEDLETAIRKIGITKDEEIANCIGRMVADTPSKPHFDYRDFIAGKRGALVAEREEASYFAAILKTLRLGADLNKIAFLIDEFEEISLQKRLTRRAAHDYLATLKKLINLTRNEDFWVVVAMTPDAVRITNRLEPALWERFTAEGKYRFRIPPLNAREAKLLIVTRVAEARIEGFDPPNELFPFPDDCIDAFKPSTYSSPRQIVKVCFYAISEAAGKRRSIPFSRNFLKLIENRVYPSQVGNGGNG